MTNIIIVGAMGKMGIEIARVIANDSDTQLVGCVDYAGHPKIGEDYGAAVGLDVKDVKIVSSIEECKERENAVIIDFSSIASTRANLERAEKINLPMVIGTTGLEKSDHDLAQKVAAKIPIIVATNMSLGVNLLFSLTEMVAQKLGANFDIEIIEAHHRLKKDSPSGTAKTLGEVAAKAIGKTYDEAVVNGRVGVIDGVRPKLEIGMHAVRGGDIVGDHTVLFAGIGERVELRHQAHSRSVFAQGAVFAAKWIANQKAGFYTMRDVLGL